MHVTTVTVPIDIMQVTTVTVPIVADIQSRDWSSTLRMWARKQKQAMLQSTCLFSSSCRYLDT